MPDEFRIFRLRCAFCNGIILCDERIIDTGGSCADCGHRVHVHAYPPLVELLNQRRIAAITLKEKLNEAKRAEQEARREQQSRLKQEKQRRREEQRQREELRRQREANELAEALRKAAEQHVEGEHPKAQAAPPPASRSKNRTFMGLAAVVVAGVLAVAGYLYLRGLPLRQALEACDSYPRLNAKVYYTDSLSLDSVTFDFIEARSARKIDLAHLMLEFAHKVDGKGPNKLVLARQGKPLYYLNWTDVHELADEYTYGNPIWSFNHLPERLHRMDGSKPYGTWTGGVLGVLKGQSEDLLSFLEAWIAG
jgi:hypothetical protein